MIILSDQGCAFKEKGKDVLLDIGFGKHLTYPPAVHQFFSPNDNCLHGSAKRSWRTQDIDFEDDVLASLDLMYRLDFCIKDVKHWFNKNMQLDLNNPSEEQRLERLKNIINPTEIKNGEYYIQCKEEYKIFMIRKNTSNTV